MSVTARLVYDPAADSSSHKVGAHVLAGDDGTQIGHVADALKVNISNTSIDVTATDLDIRDLAFATDKVDVSGSEVSLDSATLAALENITVSATDLDIRDLAFATDKVDVTGSEVSLDSATLAALENITVSATDLDIRDLTAASDSVASWVNDGAGNPIGSTGGALNVNVSSGFVDADDSLANTSIFVEARAVSTTLINLTAAAGIANRKWLYVANEGNKSVFLGPSGTTASTGFPVHPGQQSEFRIGAAVTPMVIGETGASSEDIRVMQLN
jgi:hypothetical protein